VHAWPGFSVIRVPSRFMILATRALVVLAGAEVPVPRASRGGAFERFQTAAMLHSTTHWQKTIHGYNGIQPPLSGRVFDELDTFPDDRSVATLRTLDVTTVGMHRPRYPDDVWPGVETR